MSEKTAIITLEFAHEFTDWPGTEVRLRHEASQLCPADPLWGIKEDDWPRVFLTFPEEPATFAHWVVALTIAILRWARDPVWQGQGLAISGDSITLALPWEREPIFKTALRLALHQLLLWIHPRPDTATSAQLSKTFEQWLLTVQPGGLALNTHRFALAARLRNIPVSVSIGMLRLGWGAHMERMDSSFIGRTSNLAARIARQNPGCPDIAGRRGAGASGFPGAVLGSSARYNQKAQLAGGHQAVQPGSGRGGGAGHSR